MGSSGGGGSGAVSHALYLETVQSDWLDAKGVDTIEKSVTEVMDSAIGGSPWVLDSAYDPSTDISAYETVLGAFKDILTGIDEDTLWATFRTKANTEISAYTPVAVTDLVVADEVVADGVLADMAAPGAVVLADEALADMAAPTDIVVADGALADITDAEIVADIAAFANILDDEITTKVLPRFRKGMLDINAVVSSAFPIGEAVIEAFRDREVAKYGTGLRVSAVMKNAETRLDIIRTNMMKSLEVAKHNSLINIDVNKANQLKSVEIIKTNMLKSLDVAKSNIANALDASKSNQMKSLEIVRANLSKTLGLAQAILAKDVEVGKINKTKDFQVGSANATNLLEYEKVYLQGADQMIKLMFARVAWEDDYAKLFVESSRIKIVANKEETDRNSFIAASDAKWDLEVFQHGANVLAAIGGGTVVPNMPGTDRVASTLGGAMAIIGAAAQLAN